MWTLMADSLLTGLPRLVKPTGSFSKTKAYIASFYSNNKLPSSPAAIYLPFNSCHLLFLAIVFSCLLAWPLVSLEWCMWISGSLLGFYFPTNMPQFYDWPIALFEASLHLYNHLGQHQRPSITGGQGSTGSHCDSSIISPFPFPLFLGVLFLRWRRGIASRKGKGRRRRELLSLRLCPSCVMAALGFHVLSGWVSCSSSLFPCWKSVSLRGRRRSLLCIHFSSAQQSWALLSPCWHQLLSRHLLPAWAQLADRQLSVRIKQEEDTHCTLNHHHCLLF